MAKFSDVFSNTAKVLFAAAIIIGFSFAGFVWLRSLTPSGTVSAESTEAKTSLNERDAKRNAEAESRRTQVPSSKWERVVAAGVKQHCAVKGMSKEEVEKALGSPSEKSEWGDHGGAWTYKRYDKSQCVKYAGETCAEYKETGEIVFFTPSGFAMENSYSASCWNRPLSALNKF